MRRYVKTLESCKAYVENMAAHENSPNLNSDRSNSAKEDWCKRENSMTSRKLKEELERIQKQQKIWLKDQEFERRKFKSMLENRNLMRQQSKMRTLSLPNVSTNGRLFTSFYRKPPITRTGTLY